MTTTIPGYLQPRSKWRGNECQALLHENRVSGVEVNPAALIWRSDGAKQHYWNTISRKLDCPECCRVFDTLKGLRNHLDEEDECTQYCPSLRVLIVKALLDKAPATLNDIKNRIWNNWDHFDSIGLKPSIRSILTRSKVSKQIITLGLSNTI